MKNIKKINVEGKVIKIDTSSKQGLFMVWLSGHRNHSVLGYDENHLLEELLKKIKKLGLHTKGYRDHINFRMGAEKYAIIADLADDLGISVNTFLLQLVEQFIAFENKSVEQNKGNNNE